MMLNRSSRVTAVRKARWLYGLAGVAIAAGVAFAFAWPEIVRIRINRNESAAIATLKNLSSSQSQLQASGLCDANGNSQGEYGFLGQLAGAVALRRPVGDTPMFCDPPVVSAIFANVVGGRVRLGGYWFEMFLPSDDGSWVSEREDGARVSPRWSEVLWTCYAYPVEYGSTGLRAFMLNQSGDVIATNQAARRRKYSGDHRPKPGAAGFAAGSGAAPFLDAKVSANTVDRAGDTWVVL